MTIHEEASKAYREALADGCACWRCQDAGLRAVVRRLGELVAKAVSADGDGDITGSELVRLLAEMAGVK